MQLTTAKYAAIACFGLAGVLGVLRATGVLERTADTTPTRTCEYIALRTKGEILPSGDWCFRMVQGQTSTSV